MLLNKPGDQGLYRERLWEFTLPEGREPLALLWGFICVQLLQHHTRVLSCQVILDSHTHQ